MRRASTVDAVPGAAGASPDLRERGFGRTFRSLGHPAFRRLAIGSTAAAFATWAETIGTAWLVFDLTGSSAQLGAVAFAVGMASLLVTPIGGMIADRSSRRRLVVASAVASMALGTTMATLIVTDQIAVWQIYVLGILGSTTSAIGLPARQALVHDVVPGELLPNAVAMNNLGNNFARLGGAPAFGAVAAASTAGPFVAFVLLHVVNAVTIMRLPGAEVRVRHSSARSPLHDLGAGFRYVAGDRRLAFMALVVFSLSTIVYGYVSLLAVFAEDVLDAGARGYGMLAACTGAGSVVGLILIANRNPEHHRGRLLVGCYLAHLLFVGIFSQMDHLVLAMASLATGGVFLGMGFATYNTMFQLLVRDDMRARALAIAQMANQVMMASALPVGLTIAALGPQPGLLVHVLAGASIVVVLALAWPVWREID